MVLEVTDDRLLGGRVIVRQPVTGYRAALDPVLLAAAVHPQQESRVLDAGCGSGAALFCLAARCPTAAITGVERDAEAAERARQGVDLNGCADRVRIVHADLAGLREGFIAQFDLVITNPPFAAEGTVSDDPGRAAANHESDLDLAGWIAACLGFLKPKGRLVVIHRADRVSELLAALRNGAGDLRILPIHARAEGPARRVIVDAGKARRSPDTLLPAFVLHQPDGRFTAEAEAVLRDAAPLRGLAAAR